MQPVTLALAAGPLRYPIHTSYLSSPHTQAQRSLQRLMLSAGCLAPLFGTGHAEKVRVAARSLQTHSCVCADSRGSVLMLPIVEHQVDELCNLLLSCDQFTLDG